MVKVVIKFSDKETIDYVLKAKTIELDKNTSKEMSEEELIQSFISDLEDNKVIKVYKSISDFRQEYVPIFICSWQIQSFYFEII